MTAVVCFIGASTAAGAGDEEGLGWPGRLRRMIPHAEDRFTFYNLGIRSNTSAMIAARWRRETHARLGEGAPGWVMLTMGNNDAAEFEDGALRAPLAETLANARAILGECSKLRRTLWVGPTPVDEAKMPFYSAQLGRNLTFRNARLREFAQRFAEIAAQLSVPYFDLFAALENDPEWGRSVSQNDGLHPRGAGYEAAARHIAGWDAWQAEVAGAG